MEPVAGGSDILAASVYTSEAKQVPVYFPGENEFWYQVTGDSNEVFQGGSWKDINVDITFSPVFYRSGSIIARKSQVLRSTADTRGTPYELHIVTDQNGKAAGRIYIDDFESFKYVEKKNYLYLEATFDGNSVTVASVDDDNDSSDLSLQIEALYRYSTNGDGTYTVEKFQQSKDGHHLVDLNPLERPIILK